MESSENDYEDFVLYSEPEDNGDKDDGHDKMEGVVREEDEIFADFFQDIDNEEEEDDDDDDDEGEEDYDGPFEQSVMSRPSSIAPDGEAPANTILMSIQNILPEIDRSSIPSEVTRGPKMTDLGYQISQLILKKQPPTERGAKRTGRRKLSEEEEDVYEDVLEGSDAFLEKTLSGKRRNRTGVRGRPKKVDYGFGKSTTHVLPPEVGRMMGQANIAYVSRKYEEATGLLLEVIRQAPHAFEAYQTLGLIHEEQNDLKKALSYYIIAAHLIKNDLELWRKLAKLTLLLGRYNEAIYYLSKLIHMRDPLPEYFWTRARLFVERGDMRRAIHGFRRLLIESVERDALMFQQVYMLAERLDQLDLLPALFSDSLSQAMSSQMNLTPSRDVVYFIIETLAKTAHDYEKVAAVVETVAIPLVISSGNLPLSWYAMDAEEQMSTALYNLPTEIKLYYAIALVRLVKAEELHYAWASSLDPFQFGPLMKTLGKALLANAKAADALAILLPMMEVPPLVDAELGVSIGECYRLIPGMEEMAISTFEAIIEAYPERVDARTALCDLYRQKGMLDKADQMLRVAWPSIDVNELPQNKSARPPISALKTDDVFAGLFTWDRPFPQEAEDHEAVLNIASRIAHRPVRTKKRKIRKVRRLVLFTETQIEATRSTFQQIMALDGNDNVNSLRQIRQICLPLVADFMSNPALYFTEKIRPFAGRNDLSLLHGLALEEWLEVISRYLIAEAKVGSYERAFKLSRLIITRSIYSIDAEASMRIRLIQIGIAAASPSRHHLLLNAAKWMLRALPNHPMSMPLLMRVMRKTSPNMYDVPFLRALERSIFKNRAGIAIHQVALAAFLTTERYDTAIRIGCSLLGRDMDNVFGLVGTAVSLMHQAVKRTCRNPQQMLRKAFALLYRYRRQDPHGDYNLGRAYHMLGISDLAALYYRRALNGLWREEAIFNLHLLMLLQGQVEAASHLLRSI